MTTETIGQDARMLVISSLRAELPCSRVFWLSFLASRSARKSARICIEEMPDSLQTVKVVVNVVVGRGAHAAGTVVGAPARGIPEIVLHVVDVKVMVVPRREEGLREEVLREEGFIEGIESPPTVVAVIAYSVRVIVAGHESDAETRRTAWEAKNTAPVRNFILEAAALYGV